MNKKIPKKIIKEYNGIRDKSKKGVLCHVPFKSMFFSSQGEILACCYNLKEPLGKYPENTISETWTGGKIKKLRTHIKHNDLSLGCDDCRLSLERRNYYSVGAWKYDYLPKAKRRFPVSLDFRISNVCNLECIMCSGEFSTSIRKNREKGTPYENPYDSNFIEQLEPFIPNLKEAAFTGGEPFLNELYFDIWEKMITINPKIVISISTNGTILNQRIKTIIDKLRTNIILSIDSINKDNFEKIRKNSRFETVMSNLEFFKQYTREKKTSLTVTVCPIRQNWRELPDIVRFMNEKDITLLFNNVYYPPYCSLWNLDPDEQNEIVNYLKSFTFDCQTTNQKYNLERYKNLISQISNWQDESIASGYAEILTITETTKLKEIFINKLDAFIRNDSTLTEIEKDERCAKYLKTCNFAFDSLEDEQILNTVLKYFIGYPIEKIISEIGTRTPEQFTQRTKQAAGYFL